MTWGETAQAPSVKRRPAAKAYRTARLREGSSSQKCERSTAETRCPSSSCAARDAQKEVRAVQSPCAGAPIRSNGAHYAQAQLRGRSRMLTEGQLVAVYEDEIRSATPRPSSYDEKTGSPRNRLGRPINQADGLRLPPRRRTGDMRHNNSFEGEVDPKAIGEPCVIRPYASTNERKRLRYRPQKISRASSSRPQAGLSDK